MRKSLRIEDAASLILEKHGNDYWATVPELQGCYSVGKSIEDAVDNVREAIKEYLEDVPEGMEIEQKFYNSNLKFNIKYDLQVFFEKFKMLNKTVIAEKAEINPSLLRQYSTGLAFASEKQKAKIENAIHQIAQSLLESSL